LFVCFSFYQEAKDASYSACKLMFALCIQDLRVKVI
jgi:hypothetical protein